MVVESDDIIKLGMIIRRHEFLPLTNPETSRDKFPKCSNLSPSDCRESVSATLQRVMVSNERRTNSAFAEALRIAANPTKTSPVVLLIVFLTYTHNLQGMLRPFTCLFRNSNHAGDVNDGASKREKKRKKLSKGITSNLILPELYAHLIQG